MTWTYVDQQGLRRYAETLDAIPDECWETAQYTPPLNSGQVIGW